MVPFLDLKATYEELKPELDAAVARVLSSGWYLLGDELSSFEREWAEYTESRFSVGLSNGLDALVLGLRALDIGPGDEVIVPANTYIASWLAVSAVGATPVPVEPDPRTWTLDPQRVEDAITPRCRAVMPVHLYGHPADLDPLLELARRKGLRVIEDAAQCHGARYKGRRIGSHGDVVCWSFYPGKNLGAFGDGGAITTNDADLADRIRVLRNYGSKRKYYNEVKGVNARLDELQAAVLRVKLTRLDEWNARRAAIALRYASALADLPITLPQAAEWATPVWHLYVIDVENRDAVQAALAERNVQTLIHYPVPPHLSAAYAEMNYRVGVFPISERGAMTHLSLPIGPHLAATQVDAVIDTMKCVLRS